MSLHHETKIGYVHLTVGDLDQALSINEPSIKELRIENWIIWYNKFMEQEPKIFDFEKSPMRGAYVLLVARTPLELSRRYTEEEQVLFINKTWDYDDHSQIQNRVKDILESIDESLLAEDEREWRNEILWFWYHHAISVSSWKKDREMAKVFSKKALEYLDNGNMLTRLLYFLCRDQVAEAEDWIKTNESNDDVETAREVLKEYKQGLWW